VIVIEDDHTCVGTASVQRSIASTQAWLQEILPSTIMITKATKPNDISDTVAHKHGVVIGYEAAKKAKKLALGDDLQSQAAQFAKLAAYIRAVRAADANSTAVLTTHDVRGMQRFHRLFSAPVQALRLSIIVVPSFASTAPLRRRFSV